VARVHIALIHHPVVDKNGEVIAAAVTSLDLHDIARTARTYGARGFHVVTPLEDQQVLVGRIIDHWVTGVGSQYNPDRQEALSLIRVWPTLEATLAEVAREEGERPLTVVTSARKGHQDLSHAGLHKMVRDDRPIMVIFGTAWGLAPELMENADYRLAPIGGNGHYNHLAVRSAAAIILDRMLGEPFIAKSNLCYSDKGDIHHGSHQTIGKRTDAHGHARFHSRGHRPRAR